MIKKEFDLIIPIYNEGKNLLKLFKHLKKSIKSNYRILLCYDSDKDDVFRFVNQLKNINNEFILVKNKYDGPCGAIISGFEFSDEFECTIVYPADDFINGVIVDQMYNKFLEGYDIVAPSRFMKGGSMIGCPMIKSILVRFASFTLYKFSSIPIEDASNGFRLFSRKLLQSVKIESKLGFAYSLELLVKAERMKLKITQIPSKWEERSKGMSRFKIFKWLRQYLTWYFYGIRTSWFGEKKINLD